MVVVVSSGAAVMVNPELPSDMELDESFWTDVEYANSTQVSQNRIHQNTFLFIIIIEYMKTFL
ncbi:hypothetical protein Hanom_Chr14g01249111 [Helianthus anomalus]